MKQKEITKIVESVTTKFRTFGGGHYNPASNNPIAMALKDQPAQFAAGVDVREVVAHVLKEFHKIKNPKAFDTAERDDRLI